MAPNSSPQDALQLYPAGRRGMPYGVPDVGLSGATQASGEHLAIQCNHQLAYCLQLAAYLPLPCFHDNRGGRVCKMITARLRYATHSVLFTLYSLICTAFSPLTCSPPLLPTYPFRLL